MLIEDTSRLYSEKMEYYRHVYRDSKRWNGVENLKGKKLIVYCEQGLGDTLQFLRYIPELKRYECEIYLHVLPELHRLVQHVQGVDHILDRHNPELPEHDYHIPSLSLPFAMNQMEASTGYVDISEKMNLSEFDKYFKIGIAWEGNPGHSNNEERCCPIHYFRAIHNIPGVMLFSLQKQIHRADLLKCGQDLELMGAELGDFYDTATLINALDMIVTVDTSVLHLAGALKSQKPTFALLSYKADPRWDVAEWYKNIHLVRQDAPGEWQGCFDYLKNVIKPFIQAG